MKLWPFSRGGSPASPPADRVEPTVHRAPTPQNAEQIPLSTGIAGSELYDWFTGGMSRAGTMVNEQTAMCISAVYACVGLIGGAIASMPLQTYRRDSNGDRERITTSLWWLLNEQPWPTVSAAVFWEYLAWSLLLHGDAFARIHRVSAISPEIRGFELYHPHRVQPLLMGDRLVYRLTSLDGTQETVDQDDMLHVPGVGFNGLRGMSTLQFALRNPAGIALAADEFSGDYFRNGAKSDFALVAPGKLDQAQVQQMQESWKHNRKGNAFVPPVLSGGIKLEQITLNAEDSQLIETRQMQVVEIARVFGVPPFMIGHTETTSSWGTGVEQMGIGFVKYTLQRHLVKFEQEINRKCFRTARNFAEFNTAGLERGDQAARYTAYRVALGRAGEESWMDVDEVRQLENLPRRKTKDKSGENPNEQATEAAGGQ